MRLLLLTISLIVFGACNAPAPAENKYQKLATAYCECTTQLALLNRQAEADQPSNLNGYFSKMQTEYAKAKECATTIVAQFGHLKPAELDSLSVVLATKCPELADNRDLLQELLGE